MGSIKGTTKSSYHKFSPLDERIILITDPDHPRYDRRIELPLSDNIVKDIIKKGIHTPVLAFKIGEDYEIFEGRQRVRAARKIIKLNPGSKLKIPLIPSSLKPAQSIEVAISANNQRIQDTQSVKGEKANQLSAYGYTPEDIAEQFPGASVAMVKDWMSFAEGASEGVKVALDAGAITYTKARKISRMKQEEQAEALEKATAAPKPRPGPKKGPRRRKIRIVATENENGGFDVDVESKCRLDDLDAIIDALGGKLEEWKSVAEKNYLKKDMV